MEILSEIYNKIIECPPVPPERGGILGIKNGMICSCFYDNVPAIRNSAIYIPNVELLNSKIEEWKGEGIDFGGMFHSHPENQPEPSADDIEYIKAIFHEMPKYVKSLFFPIVIPNVELLSFEATRQGDSIHIHEDKIFII